MVLEMLNNRPQGRGLAIPENASKCQRRLMGIALPDLSSRCLSLQRLMQPVGGREEEWSSTGLGLYAAGC